MKKISAVSYLNTIPFIFGLEKSKLFNQIDLHLDSPVVCANKLISGEVDIGLIPVVSFPKVTNAKLFQIIVLGLMEKLIQFVYIQMFPFQK